ncbi:MAG: hypothetical protein HY881_14260 [Deltaproteobacteria bacterium]|nr:hypothetical protein [Deltaproteobacteria bacterium]
MENSIQQRKKSNFGGLICGCMALIIGFSTAVAAPLEQPSALGGLDRNYTRISPNGEVDLLDRPAMLVHQPERSVLLDIAKAGNRIVAVGERGIVILSDDNGKTWRQAKVPTSVSLISVDFPSSTQGWVVGHSGIVLHTKDGGETWVRQLDGMVAARIAFEAAQSDLKRMGADNETAKSHSAAAHTLVDEGADKPFLDLKFKNEKEGIIVGAFGLVFHTLDGGATWTSWVNRIDNPNGFHFYTIQIIDDLIFLAGEQGLFCCSKDGGKTFKRIVTPYRGSYFCSVVSQSGRLLIAGMNGNAYWYDDQNENFTRIDVPVPVSFSASITGTDGYIFLANQAGDILRGREQDQALSVLDGPRMVQTASLIQLLDGSFVVVGVGGVRQFPLSQNNDGKAGGAM